jgi:ADP-ribose pyrophosphatase
VSGRVVYRGRSITVSVDDVLLPSGARVALDIVRHPGAAAVVPFEDDDTVLLIRQFRHAAGGFIWEIPAGKLDGDAPDVCARKELAEEAGRRAGRLVALGSILTTPGFTDEVIHLFAAFALTPVPQALEHDEVIEVVPTPLARALAMVWSGELRDAKSALALVYAARQLGRLA